MNQIKNLNQLEKKLGIVFKNKKLLLNALVHRSYLNEHKDFKIGSNERLEFLGDSIISLACSLYLFSSYPQLNEGEYTDIKGTTVKAESLAKVAKELGLGEFILMSKGQLKEDGQDNINILADTFEALVAAIFLESNFELTYQFLKKILLKKYADKIIEKKLYLSPKTVFQEFVQKKFKEKPVYKVLEEKGFPHQKTFKIGLFLNNKKISQGIGRSKKEAEEKAAQIALEIFHLI